MNFWKNPAQVLLNLLRAKSPSTVQTIYFQSAVLERMVQLDVYLPEDYDTQLSQVYPFVLFNDGQDLPRMKEAASGNHGIANTGLGLILKDLYSANKIPPIIAFGIHTSDERIREYGTSREADYKGRGDKAGAYTAFILDELMPYLYIHFRLSDQTEDGVIAGFSLGGLSAFDIGWANPDVFGVIGVFSGALWWRSSAVDPEDPDADRIMHDIVRNSPPVNGNQYFWFQCGTLDEEDDRNNNGVIDSIDDTLDLIRALRAQDIPEQSIRYLEIKNGRHDPATWGIAMVDFLEWAFVSEGDL